MTSCVSTSPFNGRVLGEFTVSSQDEIDQKMACCREAAKSWANLSVKERGQRLARFRDILVAAYGWTLRIDRSNQRQSANRGVIRGSFTRVRDS
jgi:acyl-CoA reductase-like NAD-dependent aldehyde dehydrogenase